MNRFRLFSCLAVCFPFLIRAEEILEETGSHMTGFEAVLLGIVEGVTEFLPISSTGHLLLAERILHLSTDTASEQAMDTYTIVIQMGAILAVAWIYHDHLLRMWRGLLGKDPAGWTLLRNLMTAFLPAAVVGILFVNQIKLYLFGLWPVTAAWMIGGIALLIWGRNTGEDTSTGRHCLETMTSRQALVIGLVQVVAMWPGTSRSLVTILAGRWVGLNLKHAVIFSFLLGLITLSASTVYDMARNGEQMLGMVGLQNLLIGMLAAYLSAWAAVRGMVQYLNKHGLGLFGGYRIAVAVLTALLLWQGILQP